MLLHPYLNYKLPDECNNTGYSLSRIREICSFITQVSGKSFLAALIQLFRHSGIRDRQAGVKKKSHMVSLVAVESFLPLVNVYISGGGFKAFYIYFFVPILGEVIQFDYYLSVDLKPASRCWIFCLDMLFFCLRKSIFDFLTPLDCLLVGRVWWDSASATWYFSEVELWDSDTAAGGFRHFCCLKLFFCNMTHSDMFMYLFWTKDIRVEFWSLWHKKLQKVRMDPTIRNDPQVAFVNGRIHVIGKHPQKSQGIDTKNG